VDEYVARLHEMLLDSKEHADSASYAAVAALGEKVADILRAALEAGDETLTTARAEAARVLGRAEEEAAEVIRSAQEVSGQLRQEAEMLLHEAEHVRVAAVSDAQAEVDRNLAAGHRQLEDLQRKINKLAVHKANVLSELGRLQQYLAGAESPEAAAAEGDSQTSTETPDAESSDTEPVAPNGKRSAR
jgi:cell division septum initiation protein DivIVA